MDPAKITAFEKEFLQHVKTNEKAVLGQIASEGKISDETDVKLKKIVTDFISTFSG
jgi:F-type H+-transporting ATPase subunit alpha